MRVEAIVEAQADYPDLVKGIKSHGESGGFSFWETDVLEMAVEAGDVTGLPLYIHTGELFPVDEPNRPRPETVMERVLPLVRPGDTVAHVYSCMPDGIMGPGDKVPDVVLEAYERGVHFDIGYGVNFSYRIARAMMAAKLFPNTIGSDVHADFNSYHDDSLLDYSLCGAMTRLNALGMPLADVIRRGMPSAFRRDPPRDREPGQDPAGRKRNRHARYRIPRRYYRAGPGRRKMGPARRRRRNPQRR